MSATTSPELAALFHSSFHPTKGNVIDWAHKSSDDLNLDGVEFSSLPSGMHLVDQDVIYFSKDGRDGVCVFRQQKTDDEGQRGARLGAVGLLIEKSNKSRPWKHVESLKRLSTHLEDNPEDWASLKAHYDSTLSLVSEADSSWTGWEDELASSERDHPVMHLAPLLRILGPSSLMLFKHVLACRRVLIFTRPSVESACLLARAASEMCFGHEADTSKGINVLGMVGLIDIDRLDSAISKERGWIACTTDALFLEKPYLYDLLLDLTVSATSRNSRPDFYIPVRASGSKGLRLQTARFTFSDLRVWSALDQILQADAAETPPESCALAENGDGGRWVDASRFYEDVCILCAGLWMGGCRHMDGPIRLDGDETTPNSPTTPRPRPNRTSSTMSLRPNNDQNDSQPSREVRTTLALLDAFHYHVSFLIERLSVVLSPSSNACVSPLVLTPRDLSGLQLGPFSEMDARFVEGFAESRFGRRVIVRRTWKDLMSAFLTLNW